MELKQEDFPLFAPGTRFALTSLFFNEGMEDINVTFEFYVRELPKKRNYLIFMGLSEVVQYLKDFRFTDEHLEWMKKSFDFPPDILKRMREMRFSGDLWAMPEGSIFFANEPVIRVTAPLIQAHMVEHFIINTIYSQIIIASKISRFVNAANGKEVAMGINRSYGVSTALSADRIKDVLGVSGHSGLYNYLNDDTPFTSGTYHYLIMMYKNELTAFKSYLKHMKGKGYVLVDTYNSIKGIKNFIKAAKEIEALGFRAYGIQLDSGDLYRLSIAARKMFDQAGLNYLKIFAMSNLNENKVAMLVKKNAPIDVYAGTTEILTPIDAPTLELVCKLTQEERGNKISYKVKTSTKKLSLPGKKQVFRTLENGKFIGDIIGLDNESHSNSIKLLQNYIKQGKSVKEPEEISEIRKHYLNNLIKFNRSLLSVENKIHYPVKISSLLNKLTIKTRKEMEDSPQ